MGSRRGRDGRYGAGRVLEQQQLELEHIVRGGLGSE
jgi:hypothetical protein